MSTLTSKLILQLVDGVTGRARGIAGALAGITGHVGRFNRGQAAGIAMARGFGGSLLALGAGYIGVDQGIRRTVGASIGFEEAFADVRKVVDGTDEQMSNLRSKIVGLSRVLPNSTSGLAAIMAAAGQSNVPIEELGKFTEMVAKVSVAWDTTEGETSEALAKIKTQLSMNVDQIGLTADAINHLSNTTAAQAPDLVDFMKRVAATGEMYGFASSETLAFGGAMVATGAQSEVAATSFRNMGRALTKGGRAAKQERVAFKALGLDAVKTAKMMQKNAIGTTLDVIEKIQKLPEWQRVSIASALFGDEARALMPIIANSSELRRQLGLVGNEANYAGSAFKEYLVRADTAGNALKIIGNKINATLMGIGDGWLPTIKDAGAGLGYVLDTLGDRASIFDKVSASVSGFLHGLGYQGGVRETVEAIGDLLFGKADGSGAADQLGRLFEQFRKGGAALKEFWDANKESPIAKFLGQISGYGFTLFAVGAGFTIIAGAVSGLARALLLLSGAKTAVAILTTIAKLGGSMLGITTAGTAAGAAAGTAATTATGAAAAGGGFLAALGKWFTSLGLAGSVGTAGALVQGLGDTPGDTFQEQVDNQRKSREGLQRLLGIGPDGFNWRKLFFGAAADPDFNAREHFGIKLGGTETAQAAPQENVADVFRSAIIQTKPTGTQDVKITNPTRPNVSVNVTVYATTNASAQEIGSSVGADVKSAVESSFGSADGPH